MRHQVPGHRHDDINVVNGVNKPATIRPQTPAENDGNHGAQNSQRRDQGPMPGPCTLHESLLYPAGVAARRIPTTGQYYLSVRMRYTLSSSA